MILKKLKPMPKDFLWGASTSAYQVEGCKPDTWKRTKCTGYQEGTGRHQ